MENTIKKQSRQLTKKELYMLCEAPSVSVQEAEGVAFKLNAYVLYDTPDSDGRTVEVLAILTDEGDVYSTISETFKRNFFKILDYMQDSDEEYDIKIITGTSRNGRRYVSCTIK